MVSYPDDWQRQTIEDVASIIQGGTPSTVVEEYWNGGIIWVTPTDITNLRGMRISKSARRISQLGLDNSSAVLLPAEAILLCSRATIGTLALSTTEMATNQGFKNLICKAGIDPVFLAYLLLTKKNEMLRLSIGTTFLEISKINLAQIDLHIPPLFEQRAIAEVLSGFDEHLANLNELITKKRAVRDGAIEELLTGKKRLDGFVEPWSERSIPNCGDVLTGLTYAPEDVRAGGVLVLRSSNIQEGRLYLGDNVHVCADAVISPRVEEGDILMCVRNGSARLIGKTARIDGTAPAECTFGAFMSVIRPTSINSNFLYFYTQSLHFKIQVKEVLGATINQITKRDLASFILNVPPRQEQTAIAEVLSGMDEEIRLLVEEREKIACLKLGAMDDLLTGRVRLPVDEEAA